MADTFQVGDETIGRKEFIALRDDLITLQNASLDISDFRSALALSKVIAIMQIMLDTCMV